MIWFGLWHINHCSLFNVKLYIYVYIYIYIIFGLVYGITTIVDYLIPNPF